MAAETVDALLDWLDAEADAFSGATTVEYYQNYAGLKDDLVLAPIFERHERLFQRETVDKISSADSQDPRLTNLRQFVIEGYLEQAAKELMEEIAARETADSVEWDGETIPYRAIQQRLMNEPDAARRHELDRRRLEVTADQNPLRQRRWDILYHHTSDLGFDSYVGLCEGVGGLDLGRLRQEMERFLQETERPYRDRLHQEFRTLGVEPAHAERSDLLRLFRSPQFDASFPRERMLPALEETLLALHVEAAAQEHVNLDTEQRPRKSPRAFCAPVAIPEEIYLVINPHGGHDDYRALFHEAGHAQHFAHIRSDQPFAFRGLGDNSVTEGFAFVLEHLLYNPAWLQRYLGFDDPAEYLSFVRFHKLYMLRRYAAKLLYELELHATAGSAPNAQRYAEILTTHAGARYAPEDYLADLDDGFYCARYLRAWIFEAQVQTEFKRRWGDEWFMDADAGAALRELWAEGQRDPVEQVLQRLGLPGLDMEPLKTELSVG